jgi:hypothetical protein
MSLSDNYSSAVELVTKFRELLASRPKLLWSSAAIAAALALLLRFRYTASRKAKYVLNLSNVGAISGQQGSEDYDVIIVGGGLYLTAAFALGRL